MTRALSTALLSSLLFLSGLVAADELTQMVQQDLVTLGYEPGNTTGEATVETIVAISKFQAEHELEVTGEATPQLAGVIKAAISQSGQAAAGAAAPAAPPVAAAPAPDAAALAAAQQACLQQKVAAAQEAQQQKRGLARLARAVTRTASRLGGDELSAEIAQLSTDVYDAQAIAGDFMSAAEDLGLTESDIEACRNPS